MWDSIAAREKKDGDARCHNVDRTSSAKYDIQHLTFSVTACSSNEADVVAFPAQSTAFVR